MAKTKSDRNKGGKKSGNWSNVDHEARMAKRIQSLQKKRDRKERAFLEQNEDHQHHVVDYDEDKPAKKKLKHEQPLHQKRNKNYRNKHVRLAAHVPEHTYMVGLGVWVGRYKIIFYCAFRFASSF